MKSRLSAEDRAALVACYGAEHAEHVIAQIQSCYTVEKLLRRVAEFVLAEADKSKKKDDQAADDEAWFYGMTMPEIEAGAPERWVASCVLAANGIEVASTGPTIAAAIRALREKVEGGAR